MKSNKAEAERAGLLRHALRLEYFTVGWNIIEGLIAVAAAVAAGSIALLGFGIDSFVETLSGLILIWRLRTENGRTPATEIDRIDRLAYRLVGASLFVLAAYIGFDAGKALLLRERPEASNLGIAITALSMGIMWWLAREKAPSCQSTGQPRARSRLLSDDGLLVAFVDDSHRDRSQCRPGMGVGRPRGGVGHDLLPGQRGDGSMAQRRMLLLISPELSMIWT